MAAGMLRQAASATGDAGIVGLKLNIIADAVNELIGRYIDPNKLRAMDLEAQEARRIFHGLDADDIQRLEHLHNQRNKPQ